MVTLSSNFELFPDDKVIIQAYKSLQGTNQKDLQEKLKVQNASVAILNAEIVLLFIFLILFIDYLFKTYTDCHE